MSCWWAAIDWDVAGSFLAGVGGIMAGFATVFLAVYARRGLSAWKDQQFGTRKLELAQDLLSEIYMTHEVLTFIVNPFVGASELDRVERVQGETDADYELRRTYDAVIIRYEDHAEHFSKVRAMLFRARAVLGDEIYEAVREILLLRNAIQSAAHNAFQTSRRVTQLERRAIIQEVPSDEYAAAFDAMRAAQDRFWNMGQNGTLQNEIDASVEKCAELIRGKIAETLT